MLKPVRIFCLSLLCLSILLRAESQTSSRVEAYPTYQTLQTTILPIADRESLARDFLGIRELPLPPDSVALRQVGERETFFISNAALGASDTVEAELRAIGSSVYVWVEIGGGVTNRSAQDFAQRFDTEIYEQTRRLWGSEARPGIDGDEHIYAVFTTQVVNSIAAYYAGQNSYSRVLVPNSNEHEMLVFNLNSTGAGIHSDLTLSYAAHEFQHMIRREIDLNEEAWVDEGFSMLTEYLLGYADTTWALHEFVRNPETPLTTWGLTGNRRAEYGAPLMLLLYFYERFGLEGLQVLGHEEADGIIGLDHALKRLHAGDANTFFADWVLANILRDEGIYSYQSLPSVVPNTAVTRPSSLPLMQQHELGQYATRYYMLENPPRQINISLIIPESARLIPVDAVSGEQFWYSNRGDDSRSSLQRSFDLRNVTHAQLDFQIWYDLESDWDYGYVSVSPDNGTSWQIQPTRLTTSHDPNGKTYGASYTGASEGWQADSLNLDAFVGQEILVRFDMVTDDSIHRAGLALDDLRLEAVGYFSDLEADNGAWQAAGWLHTDNRLPQEAWLQAVQERPDGILLTRWIATGAQMYTLNLEADTSRLTLAFSPFALLTTEEIPYLISIDGK